MLNHSFQYVTERFPQTLLGCEKSRRKHFVPSKNTYFFNRCRQSFEAILYYYQSGGILVRPSSIPMHVFEREVKFYQLGQDVLLALHQEEWCVRSELDGNRETQAHTLTPPNFQHKIWRLFEHPDSSLAARMVSLWSMFVIGLSILVFCMETLPEYKVQPNECATIRGNSSTCK